MVANFSQFTDFTVGYCYSAFQIYPQIVTCGHRGLLPVSFKFIYGGMWLIMIKTE